MKAETDHMDGAHETKAPKTASEAQAEVASLLKSGAAAEARYRCDAALKIWPSDSKLLLQRGEVLTQLSGKEAGAMYYAGLLERERIAQWAAGRLAPLLRDASLTVDQASILASQVCGASIDPQLKIPLIDALLVRDVTAERDQLLEAAGSAGILKYESKLAAKRAEEGDFDGALRILERARYAGRQSMHTGMLLADLLSVSGRLPDAIGLLEDLLEQYPEQPDVYRRLTMLLQRARDFVRASEVFEAAARRWPHDWTLVFRLNRLPIERTSLRKIFDIFAANAAEVLGKNARFRFQFALACLHIGEVSRGLALLEEPFEEPIAGMAKPVQKALVANTARDWLNGSRLDDDRTKEVQIARAADARGTVVLTTGIAFGNLPLALIDTLFARHDLNVIYLRDFGKRAYLRGIATLGSGETETIAALQRLVADLGARRTIAMGSSSGGFSALRYGAQLGAHTAVSFSGPTAMTLYFGDTRASAWNPNYFVKALIDREPDLPFDLVPILSKEWQTRFLQYYGQQSAEDERQALRLAGLPGVTLRPIDGVSDHYVVDHMIGNGGFEALLEEILTG